MHHCRIPDLVEVVNEHEPERRMAQPLSDHLRRQLRALPFRPVACLFQGLQCFYRDQALRVLQLARRVGGPAGRWPGVQPNVITELPLR